MRRAFLSACVVFALTATSYAGDPPAVAEDKGASGPFVQHAPKLDPKLTGIRPDAIVPVAVILEDQPQTEIARRYEMTFDFQLKSAETHYVELVRSNAAADTDLQRASEALDAIVLRMRQEMFGEIARAVEPSQAVLETTLTELGAQHLVKHLAINMIGALLPAAALKTLENDPTIARIVLLEPQEAQLATSVPALGASAFWNAGYTGGSQTVAVLDSGVRTNHPAFSGKSLNNQVFLGFGQYDQCFADDVTSVQDQVGHGTHVAGIVMSQGSSGWSSYQGVAKGLGTLYNVKIGFRLSSACSSFLAARSSPNDVEAGLGWVLQQTPAKIINYSYGATISTDDDWWAQMVDRLADTYGALIVVSAGNSGPNAYTVNTPGIAYNVLTVANWSSRGSIYYDSSRGPTSGGRYKPDIAAPGTNIYSAAFDWDGYLGLNPDFVAMTGTSMAAPHIAGAAALLKQAGVLTPLEIKAVLLNSTDNTGWTSDRGWGYANLNSAKTYANYHSMAYLTANGLAYHYQLYKITAPGTFRVTATWNRHVSSSTSYFNDVDLYAYNKSTGSALANSIANTQNVEQINSSSSSDVIVKAHMASSTLAGGINSEKVGVAMTSSFTEMNGPKLAVSCSAPSSVTSGAAFQVSCSVSNTGDLPAFGAVVDLSLPSGFTGSTHLSYGTIQSGSASGSLSTTITASSTAGGYTINENASSSSYGETITGSTSSSVTVGAQRYLLTTSVSPAGAGYITASPYSGDGTYTSGTKVCLAANAYSGYQFSYWSGDPLDGSGCLIMSTNRSVTANFGSTPSTGTIAVNAKKDGVTWTGNVTLRVDGPTFVRFGQVPASINNASAGTYTLTYESGGPAGTTVSGITPSATQSLTGGGTITFTVNFTTTPTTGMINVNATLNGAAWSGSLSYQVAGPATLNGSSVPATHNSAPAGTYTISYLSGGPGGIPSVANPTQTLGAAGAITYTFAFTSISLPNLTPYQPNGWSGKIVVSKVTGTSSDDTGLRPTDNLYVDWAAINSGTASVNDYCDYDLLLDGTSIAGWYSDPPIAVNGWVYVPDYALGTLSPGLHTLTLIVDSSNAIAESSESDNQFTKTFVIGAGAPSDFDSDGRSDVLWRNHNTGTTLIWSAQPDGSLLTFTPFARGSGTTDYQIAAVNEFGLYPGADIVWRRSSTQQLSTEYMTAGVPASESPWASIPSSVVAVSGSGDLDGDGVAELVMRNTQTGATTRWTPAQQTPIHSGANLNWNIIAVRDFDGDGKADILWRESATGMTLLWFMNGAAIRSSQIVHSGGNTDWSIAGTGDFDGDGKCDILWRHNTIGMTLVWLMDGVSIRSSTMIHSGGNLNWAIGGVGDYNGDGKTDILWRESSTGWVLYWQMNVSTITRSVSLHPGVSADWDIVAARF